MEHLGRTNTIYINVKRIEDTGIVFSGEGEFVIRTITETKAQHGVSRIFRDQKGRFNLFWRVTLGWLAFVAGLSLAVVIATAAASYEIPTLGLQILLAVVTTSVSVPLIYLLRRYVDQRPGAA